MSASPESKDELMPLRRSTRKSVAAKVEEQVLTPKKRKSTATPLKNAPEKAADNAGTPRKTRGTATPRKSMGDQISLTPRKSVSNARTESSPKKKEVATPRKSVAAHTSPMGVLKESNKHTPMKSNNVQTSPVSTPKGSIRRTPRKSVRTKEVVKADGSNVDEEKHQNEEVPASTRGRRRSVAASSLKKNISPVQSIKDSDSGIVSFDEDSQSTIEEQKQSPKRKSRKSVHFKQEVDEHHLEPESEQFSSPSPKKSYSMSSEILNSSLALVPRVVLKDISPTLREAKSAESAIVQAPFVDMRDVSDKFETKVPSEESLDKVLLSPAKFLTSDEDGPDKGSYENPEVDVSHDSDVSSLNQEFPKSNAANESIKSEKQDKHKSPRRKLAYESQSKTEPIKALNLEKSIDTETDDQKNAEVIKMEPVKPSNETSQSNKEVSDIATESAASNVKYNEKNEVETPTSSEDKLSRISNSLSPTPKSPSKLKENQSINTPVSNSSPASKIISESNIVTTSKNDLNVDSESPSMVVNFESGVTSCNVNESPVSSSEISKFEGESKTSVIKRIFDEEECQGNSSYSVSSTGDICETELSLLEKGHTDTDCDSELQGMDSSNVQRIENCLDESLSDVIKDAKSASEPTVSGADGSFDIQVDVVQSRTANEEVISSMPNECGPLEVQSDTSICQNVKNPDEVCESDSASNLINNSLSSSPGKGGGTGEPEDTVSPGDNATQIVLDSSFIGKGNGKTHADEDLSTQTDSVSKSPELTEETSNVKEEGPFLKSDGVVAPDTQDELEISEGNEVIERSEKTDSSVDSSKHMDDLNSSKLVSEVISDCIDSKLEINVESSDLSNENVNGSISPEKEVDFDTSKSEIHEKASANKIATLIEERDVSLSSPETENKVDKNEILSNSEINNKQSNFDYSKSVDKENENKDVITENADCILKSPETKSKENTKDDVTEVETDPESLKSEKCDKLNESVLSESEEVALNSSTILNEESNSPSSRQTSDSATENGVVELDSSNVKDKSDADIELKLENVDDNGKTNKRVFISEVSSELDYSKSEEEERCIKLEEKQLLTEVPVYPESKNLTFEDESFSVVLNSTVESEESHADSTTQKANTSNLETVIDKNTPHLIAKNKDDGEEINVVFTKVGDVSPNSLPSNDGKDNSIDDVSSVESNVESPKNENSLEDLIDKVASVSEEQSTSNDDSSQEDLGTSSSRTDSVIIESSTTTVCGKDVISETTLLGKRTKRSNGSEICKKPNLEKYSSDQELSSRTDRDEKDHGLLGKRSPETYLNTDLKKCKVTPENKKRSNSSKKNELKTSGEKVCVSDFFDLEAEEGEESEIPNSSSNEESSQSSSSVTSTFDFIDKEAKEYTKTCHVGTLDKLFNETLSENEEDTDWLPPKNLANNLASISFGQKLKKDLQRTFKKTGKKSRSVRKKLSTSLMTKAGIFSYSIEPMTINAKITAVPRGFTVSVSDKSFISENYIPKGFVVTETKTEKNSGKSNESSSSMLPVSVKSSKLANTTKTDSEKCIIETVNQKSLKSSNGDDILKFTGMAVLPKRLKNSELKEAFGAVGINDILSVQYNSQNTALLEFGDKKSLKKALNLYGQIMHSGKPIYVLETKVLS